MESRGRSWDNSSGLAGDNLYEHYAPSWNDPYFPVMDYPPDPPEWTTDQSIPLANRPTTRSIPTHMNAQALLGGGFEQESFSTITDCLEHGDEPGGTIKKKKRRAMTEDEEKQRKRRKRNRQKARKAREAAKATITKLQMENHQLKDEREVDKATISRQQDEIIQYQGREAELEVDLTDVGLTSEDWQLLFDDVNLFETDQNCRISKRRAATI